MHFVLHNADATGSPSDRPYATKIKCERTTRNFMAKTETDFAHCTEISVTRLYRYWDYVTSKQCKGWSAKLPLPPANQGAAPVQVWTGGGRLDTERKQNICSACFCLLPDGLSQIFRVAIGCLPACSTWYLRFRKIGSHRSFQLLKKDIKQMFMRIIRKICNNNCMRCF